MHPTSFSCVQPVARLSVLVLLMYQYILPSLKFARALKVTNFSKFVQDCQFQVYVNVSRLFVPLRSVGLETRTTAMHFLYEKIASVGGKYNLTMLAFDASFPLAAQSDILPSNALGSLIAASLSMLLVALIFVPNILCCLAVMCTVASINIGVFTLLVGLENGYKLFHKVS